MQAIRWLLYADYYTLLLFITKVLMNYKSGYKIQQLLITYTLAWERTRHRIPDTGRLGAGDDVEVCVDLPSQKTVSIYKCLRCGMYYLIG